MNKDKVLGISEGGEHTSEISGDILHYERERHIALLACGMQYIVSQRKKGQQRAISFAISIEPMKVTIQAPLCKRRILRNFYYVAGENIKELYVLRAHTTASTLKKAGKRLVIEIIEIFLVGRNYK